jgi:hypothetical protein
MDKELVTTAASESRPAGRSPPCGLQATSALLVIAVLAGLVLSRHEFA